MTLKAIYKQDEHGCYLCPLCSPSPYVNPSDECGWRGLHVRWEYSVPLEANMEAIRPEQAPQHAVTSRWWVECINGHVIAGSAGEYDGADDAEPFSLDLLPTLLGTERVEP